jgi:uncharacterized membrane protein YcaP (DUF421 family)
MAVAVEKPRVRKYSRASLAAGDRLLQAIKAKMLREKGKVDFEELRRAGYSEELLARLREV